VSALSSLGSARDPSRPSASRGAAEDGNQSDRRLDVTSAQRLREQQSKSALEQELYQLSPFSFIDKVIANPYTEEFVYLNPRGPYDLQIVRHDQINPSNYCTMSRAGMTHFYQNETDFTSLDQWEREYYLYTRMMEIDFFKKFRAWKTFYFWKKYIRRTKHAKCKKILQDNLYILSPYLRPSLLHLRKLCWEASQWNIFKLLPNHTLTLEQFREAQEMQKQEIAVALEQLQAGVRSAVLEACDTDLRQFLVDNGFRKARSDASRFDDLQVDEDYPQKISHAEKAAIKSKCRKLFKFILLADYLVIDTLVTLSFERTRDLLRFIQRKPMLPDSTQQGKAKRRAGKDDKNIETPIFQVELRLDELHEFGGALRHVLTFAPELQDYQTTMEHTVVSGVRRVMAPRRLVADPEFAQYTHVTHEEQDDDQAVEFKVELMVLQDPVFLDVKSAIRQSLSDAFDQAATQAKELDKYRDLFTENCAFDISRYADEPVARLSELIAKYQAQVCCHRAVTLYT